MVRMKSMTVSLITNTQHIHTTHTKTEKEKKKIKNKKNKKENTINFVFLSYKFI
jgi:hypothetical protein